MKTLRILLLALASASVAAANGPICPVVGGYNYPRTGGDWHFMIVNVGTAPIDFAVGGWVFEDGVGGSTDVSGWGVVGIGDVCVVTAMTAVDFVNLWGSANVVGSSALSLAPQDTVFLSQGPQVIDALSYIAPQGQNPHPSRQGYKSDLGTGSDVNWVDASEGDAFGSYVVQGAGIDYVGNPTSWTCAGRPLGVNYCTPAAPNSTGLPGVIIAERSDVVADNDFALRGVQLPPNQFGYFLASETQGLSNPPNSQGTLCLGGLIGRFTAQVGNTGAVGQIFAELDLTAFPPPLQSQVLAGETWNFQLWYRDLNPGATSNFTDGVSVLFL